MVSKYGRPSSSVTMRSSGTRVGVSSRVARTRDTSSAKAGSPDRSTRMGRVSTKNPMRSCVPGRSRPANGTPVITSSWPLHRCSSAWNAANNTVNGLAPAALATCSTRARRSASLRRTRAPRLLATAGRGRSAGSASGSGRGLSTRFQYGSASASSRWYGTATGGRSPPA